MSRRGRRAWRKPGDGERSGASVDKRRRSEWDAGCESVDVAFIKEPVLNRIAQKMVKRLGPWLAAGVLLQAGSCDLGSSLGTGLFDSVFGILITSLIAGALGLGGI